MSQIELRLSKVDPPAPEPKRTIYRDIVNLPDPVKLGLTIRYFNYDDVGLYFQITGSGPGYTFGTVNLGLLASGANAYQNLDEFASRAKPSVGDLPNGEMEENITLILRAYTDSGYSNLKWTFERVVTVHWINSADAAFTVDVLNNFDDGTVQGWAETLEAGTGSGTDWIETIAAATDYVLSTPYSLKTKVGGGCDNPLRFRVWKNFTTPNKSKVFAIADVRVGEEVGASPGASYFNNFLIMTASVTLIYLGKPGGGTQDRIPRNKWIRIVVPLAVNTTLELRLVLEASETCFRTYSVLWLDDFKLISK